MRGIILFNKGLMMIINAGNHEIDAVKVLAVSLAFYYCKGLRKIS